MIKLDREQDTKSVDYPRLYTRRSKHYLRVNCKKVALSKAIGGMKDLFLTTEKTDFY
jgi:hypothetical protein